MSSHAARMCDPEGVWGELIPYVVWLWWGCSPVTEVCPCQTALTPPPASPPSARPRDSYQVLESLPLGLGGEFRRHGDDFSISDDYGPGTGKIMHQASVRATDKPGKMPPATHLPSGFTNTISGSLAMLGASLFQSTEFYS